MHNVGDYLLRVLLDPRVRSGLAWFVAVATVVGYLFFAWHALDVKDEHGNYRRSDHNNGHAQIDFASQWLLARMLVEGHGHELYHRGYQREIVRAGYPRDHEVPDEQRKEDERGSHDAEDIMGWMISREDPGRLVSPVTPLAAADPVQAIVLVASGQAPSEPDWEAPWDSTRLQDAIAARGGPLYPPIHPLFFYPLGLLEPQSAYRVNQVANMLFAILAALGIRQLSQGRLWCPLALLAILAYPGFRGSINLAQNATLSLAILTWGWVLVARGRPGWGGLVWSLLAFKPVWAVAFFLVPLLTRRWRACIAMLAGGIALVLLTLPFVGWQSWLDWFENGRAAAHAYALDFNWIHLSRDLLNIPRRWLLVFPLADETRNWWGTLLGWGLWFAVVGSTAWLAFSRKQQARATTGPVAAFLLLGGWMSCYHFMYYDVLLSALPVLLLFTEPRQFLEPIYLALVPLRQKEKEEAASYLQIGLPRHYPSDISPLHAGLRHIVVLNRFAPTMLALLLIVENVFPLMDLFVTVRARIPPLSYAGPSMLASSQFYTPWDAYCLFVLWLWCGWQWLRNEPEAPARVTGAAPC